MPDIIQNNNTKERYARLLLLLEQAEAEAMRLKKEGRKLEKNILAAIDADKHHKVLNFIKNLPDN